MKKSLLSRLFFRRSATDSRSQTLTPDDIRRKLEGYKQDGSRAEFGMARLYSVEENPEDTGTATPNAKPGDATNRE